MQTTCPICFIRVTGAPVSRRYSYGEKLGPPKLKQTPETFEQGGSSVNDLWIQGVSHLPEWVSPFRKLLLLTTPQHPYPHPQLLLGLQKALVLPEECGMASAVLVTKSCPFDDCSLITRTLVFTWVSFFFHLLPLMVSSGSGSRGSPAPAQSLAPQTDFFPRRLDGRCLWSRQPGRRDAGGDP